MPPALDTNRQEHPRRSTRNSSSRRIPRTRTLPKPHATLNTLVHKPDVITAPSTAVALVASQSVSVQMSIEVSESMLHGALSIVAYERGMFHDDCYETRYYVSGSDQYTYHDYTNKVHNIAHGRDNSGRLMIALKKGVSERVDRFHQLLEHGVFDALKRGYVSSLQLSIHENPEQLLENLETYTFSFNYAPASAGIVRSLASMDITDCVGSVITIHQAKLSLNDFVRKLNGHCASLPVLPEEKCIVLSIKYTDIRPDSYFAPGFEEPVTDLARFPVSEDWKRVTTNITDVNLGQHTVALVATHLGMTRTSVSTKVPVGMEYGESIGKFDDFVTNWDERKCSRSKYRNASNSSKGLTSSSLLLNQSEFDLSPLGKLGQNTTPLRSSDKTHPPKVSTASVSITDVLEKQQLQAMLPSTTNYSNDESTQRTQNINEAPQMMNSTGREISEKQKIGQFIQQQGSTSVLRDEVAETSTTLDHLVQIMVRCSCGYNGQEGDMIKCECCGYHQHLHCYGYFGNCDDRIPGTHMCYPCLFQQEAKPLRQLRDQTLTRRALWLLLQTPYDDDKAFAQALGWNNREIYMLKKKLKSKGLLATSSGSSRTATTHIALNHSDAVIKRMRQTYFDPTFGITHQLETYTSNEASGPHSAKRAHQRGEDGDGTPAKRLKGASAAVFIDVREAKTPKAPRHQ